MLQPHFMCDYDETQAIGKRYRRQDEIGTPFCVTVDFDSLEDQAVTVRERDSMAQDRRSTDRRPRRLPPPASPVLLVGAPRGGRRSVVDSAGCSFAPNDRGARPGGGGHRRPPSGGGYPNLLGHVELARRVTRRPAQRSSTVGDLAG